jgi:hypothetical protein
MKVIELSPYMKDSYMWEDSCYWLGHDGIRYTCSYCHKNSEDVLWKNLRCVPCISKLIYV